MEYKNIREDFFFITHNASPSYTSLSYTIFDGDTPVYFGKAYKNPMTGFVTINVAQRIRDYLANEMPDYREYDGVMVEHPDALKVFTLTDDAGNQLEQYQVMLEWSDPFDGADRMISRPINTHADPRQKLFFPFLSSAGTAEYIDEDGGGGGNVSGTPNPNEIWVNKEAYTESGKWFRIRYRPQLDSPAYLRDIYGELHPYGTVDYEVIETETHIIIRFPFGIFESINIKFDNSVKDLHWVKFPPSFRGETDSNGDQTINPVTGPYEYNMDMTSITMTYSEEWVEWYAMRHPSWLPGNYNGILCTDRAFKYNKALTEFVFPSGVTANIGSYSFLGCSALERVDIQSTSLSIATYSFADCTSLNYVSLPAQMSIDSYVYPYGGYVFSNTALTSIDYRGTMAQFNALGNKEMLAPSGMVIHCTDGDITL